MAQDFDLMLQRPIQLGNEFDSLIESSNCKSSRLGYGDTAFSMQQMHNICKETSYHVSKLAPLLSRSTIVETCDAIFDFLYHHIQYSADDELQVLRSPGCSWSQRKAGIDCKSFSIFAAGILRELGIDCYFRRIKQPGYFPQEFTHVYVVVPINQKKNELGQYAVVDATTHDNIEPQYVIKDDLFMKGLPHVALRSAAPASTNQLSANPNTTPIPSSNSSFWNTLSDKIQKLNLKNILASLSCIGGSSFSSDKLKGLNTYAGKYFAEMFVEMNMAVNANDAKRFGEIVAEFKLLAKTLPDVYQKSKDGKNWSSNCTKNNLESAKKLFEFYRDTVGAALDAWINQYFVRKGQLSVMSIRVQEGVFELPPYLFDHANIRGYTPFVAQEIVYNYDLKDSIEQVKAFEFTDYAAQNAGKNTFDPLQFIAGLSTVVASFQQPTSVNSGSSGEYGFGDANITKTNSTKSAGISTGLVIVGALLIGSTLLKKKSSNGK